MRHAGLTRKEDKRPPVGTETGIVEEVGVDEDDDIAATSEGVVETSSG